MEPAYLIGGELRSTGTNADWGDGEWLVVEADESDRSMLSLDVDVAVVTNVELDHHATFASLAEVRDVFRQFLDGPPEAVLWDRPDVVALRGGAPAQTFDVREAELSGDGVALRLAGDRGARSRCRACTTRATRRRPWRPAGWRAPTPSRRPRRLRPSPAPGGASSAWARPPAARWSSTTTPITPPRSRRRSTPRARRGRGGSSPSSSPTSTRARRAWRGEFGAALARADVAAVLDVYPARERAEDFPGVDGRLVAQAVADARKGAQVLWLPGFDDAERVLAPRLGEGDLCLVLGAGDIDALGRRLVAA